MEEYDELILKTFLEKQMQLFPEQVADSYEEAGYFLEELMAVVCRNAKEVEEYFREEGVDVAGMTEDELLNQAEVFAIPDGRYLIVEG